MIELLTNVGLIAAIAPGDMRLMGAAIAVGLAALGAGIAESGIGAAAMGAIAEDESLFGTGLIFTVLPETLVILALVTIFLVRG